MYGFYFPVNEHHPVLCQAMDIAMNYVRGTGLAEGFHNSECLVATAIDLAWRRGVRHHLVLANEGIVTARKTAEQGSLPLLYPRVI
jgi:hypothetical protein